MKEKDCIFYVKKTKLKCIWFIISTHLNIDTLTFKKEYILYLTINFASAAELYILTNPSNLTITHLIQYLSNWYISPFLTNCIGNTGTAGHCIKPNLQLKLLYRVK